MTLLNYLGTEFVHARLLQGNSPQSDENLVKQPLEAWGSVKWYKNKGKAGLGRSLGPQEVEASRFQDGRHMKVVRL